MDYTPVTTRQTLQLWLDAAKAGDDRSVEKLIGFWGYLGGDLKTARGVVEATEVLLFGQVEAKIT